MAQNLENAQSAVNGQAPDATNNTVAAINLNSNAIQILGEANLKSQQRLVMHERKELKEDQEPEVVKGRSEAKDKVEKKKGAEVVRTKQTLISDLSPALRTFLSPAQPTFLFENDGDVRFQLTGSINSVVNGFTPLLLVLHQFNNVRLDFVEELLNLPDIELHHKFSWMQQEFTALTKLIRGYHMHISMAVNDASKQVLVEKYFRIIEKVISLCPELTQHSSGDRDPGCRDLYDVAQHGELRCLQLMLQPGCNVDLPNGDGTTPLYGAAIMGNTENCQFLIDSNANLDAGCTEHGGNALHDIAYFGGPAESVAFLLVSGFKYNLRNKYGATPFSITQTNPTQYPQYVRDDIDNSAETVQIALNNRRQISEMLQAIDHFFNAVSKGDIKTAQEFLAAGIPVNARNMQGRTALHIACQAKVFAMTRLLLQNNAKLTVLDDENQTPLDLASSANIGILMNVIQKVIDAKILYLKQHLWLCAGRNFEVLPYDLFENISTFCGKFPQFATTPKGRSFVICGMEKAFHSKEIHLLAVRAYDAWHEKVSLANPLDQTAWLKAYRLKKPQRLLELSSSGNPNQTLRITQKATPQ